MVIDCPSETVGPAVLLQRTQETTENKERRGSEKTSFSSASVID